jgi:hypothetical protein
MAKQGKMLPARRQRDRGESSVLLRSAESLGRVIGLLQRQLDGPSTRVSNKADTPTEHVVGNNGHRRKASSSARASTTYASNGNNKSPSTPRKSKARAKSATAKMTSEKRVRPKTAASRKRRSA